MHRRYLARGWSGGFGEAAPRDKSTLPAVGTIGTEWAAGAFRRHIVLLVRDCRESYDGPGPGPRALGRRVVCLAHPQPAHMSMSMSMSMSMPMCVHRSS